MEEDDGFDDWYADWYREDPVGVETLWGEGWSWVSFHDKFISEKC